MRSRENASAIERGRCRLTHLACEILDIRYPNLQNPIEEWLPSRPDWSTELPDIDILRHELTELKDRGGKVVLYGHDDMDGITGIYIGRRILEGEGYQVVPIMPRRLTDDYGLLPERMEGVLLPGDLLLTVDYGCSAVRGVKWAIDLGARVVITDHHTLHHPLPPAHGMINPQRVGPPATYMAGCSVLYAALISIYPGWENQPELLTANALGTVSDRVPLLGWNRYLLEEFRKIDADELKGGMAVLAEAWPAREKAWTGSMVRHAITSVIGKGKDSGIEILLDFMNDDDYKQCRKTWKRLKKNSRRRAHVLSEIFSRALQKTDDQASAYGMNLVYLDHIPDGMGGTLASKMSRITRRGTLIVSQRESGKLVGEARSYGDWDMADFLVSMGDVYTSAGGHRMAAGFSCEGKSWSQLRELLLSRMASYPIDPVPVPHVDLVVDELPDPAEFLCLAPFGGEFLPPAVQKGTLRYLMNIGENSVSWFITEESGD
ncbi:MAG: DHH family phosphoesterase [Candidatus Aegiribacteria sp.]|nr:DHH family phosphoesterase [Candidatus Aegiribacteria sp.]